MDFWSGWPMPPDTYEFAHRWQPWVPWVIVTVLGLFYSMIEPMTRGKR